MSPDGSPVYLPGRFYFNSSPPLPSPEDPFRFHSLARKQVDLLPTY